MKTDLSKAVIYQLYPRTFTSEGTLKEAEKLIPHLHDLGIDIISMSACNTEETSPHGQSVRQIASGMNNIKNPYRISDYFNVDEEYGTMDDLRDFVKAAHKYGLKVLIDLVYLHCGANAVFLKEHPEFVIRDENGEIIGSVRAYQDTGTVYIGKLMVHPDMQNKGIGTRLLLEIENVYPNQRFELFTSTRSIRNIKLYEKLGYETFKEERVSKELQFVYMQKG